MYEFWLVDLGLTILGLNIMFKRQSNLKKGGMNI